MIPAKTQNANILIWEWLSLYDTNTIQYNTLRFAWVFQTPSTSQINRAQTLRPDQTPHIIEWNGKFLKFIFIFGLKPNSSSKSQSQRQQKWKTAQPRNNGKMIMKLFHFSYNFLTSRDHKFTNGNYFWDKEINSLGKGEISYCYLFFWLLSLYKT